VIATPHGHDPQFGVGYHEGNESTHPYPGAWETLHGLYSFTLTLLLCVLLLATNARRAATATATATTATECPVGEGVPDRQVVWVTAVAGVVSVCLVALQMQGTYLVYSTWRGRDPTTGSGLWLTTTTVLLAAV